MTTRVARRKLLLPGIGLLLALGPTLTAAQNAGRYVDKIFHFGFTPPAGWKRVTENMPENAVLYQGPKDKDVAPSILVRSEIVSSKMTLDNFVQQAREQAKMYRGASYIGGEGKAIKLDGVPAYTWRKKIQTYRKEVVETRQIFSLYNSRGYTLTLTAQADVARKYDKTFDAVLASFRWEKEKK